MEKRWALVLGILIASGLYLCGWSIAEGIIEYRKMERVVSVKGLSSKEVDADRVIWPIQYVQTGNDLPELYSGLEKDKSLVENYLMERGFKKDEFSVSMPLVTDKLSDQYSNDREIKIRYIASQTLTLYTSQVEQAREAMLNLAELGKQGVSFKASSYENRPIYKYSKLNDIKPQMIEEATLNARAAAQKFADDSQSKLGKIKSASQGQFIIENRDEETPHKKVVRVVSTVNYYLND